jgi:hypothetical protein
LGVTEKTVRRPIDIGGLSLEEHSIVIEGLEMLRIKLLEDAGRLASRKLSRHADGLREHAERGYAVLRRITTLKSLQQRLLDAVGGTDKSS